MKRTILLTLLLVPLACTAQWGPRSYGPGPSFQGKYRYINPPPEALPYSPYHERYYRNYELNRKRYEPRREDPPRLPQKGVRGMIPR